jgi:hypothetical protein
MNSLGAGVLIFIMLVVGVMGFVMLSGSYQSQYANAISDPTNNTIDNASYNLTKDITQPIGDNLDIVIFMGLLFFIILLIFAIKEFLG